ncbi:MAG: hypothetical protein K0R28_2693 [Paenibacillus sp.]|jgi:hypothetical protein|nr:hypothetical protein [Paenibacillus sp.]
MSRKILIKQGRAIAAVFLKEGQRELASVVTSLSDEVEHDYLRSKLDSGLKKGDKVVMHTCMEARNPNYAGKIWMCRTDAFRHKGHDYESIFLEDFSGSFSAKYLVKVNVPEEMAK